MSRAAPSGLPLATSSKVLIARCLGEDANERRRRPRPGRRHPAVSAKCGPWIVSLSLAACLN